MATYHVHQASASPASCSSTGALSYAASSSSLTYTETDFWKFDISDDFNFGDDVQEVSRRCSGSSHFESGPLEKQLVSGELCRLIREDLEKQRYRRVKMASIPSPPLPPPARAVGAGTGPGSAPPMRGPPAQRRAVLVDWMRQVTHALQLQLPTLFIATSILDRVLTARPPPDWFLELLPLTSMSIAVKYNEVYLVAQDVWLGLALSTSGERLYSARDLQRYEITVLHTIDWNMQEPTTFTFLEHFLRCQLYGCGHMEDKAQQNSDAMESLSTGQADLGPVCTGPIGSRAAMLAEASLMDDTFLMYDSSAVALACVVLAERMASDSDAPYVSQLHDHHPQSQWLQRPLPAAAVAVAAVSGLKLELVAPNLEFCVNDLAKCYAAEIQPADGNPAVTAEA